MSALGEIYFADAYNLNASIYIRGALSLSALKAYCETLRQFTAAAILNLKWCEQADVEYDRTKAYGERKLMTYAAPIQEMVLMWSGQPGDAYGLDYYASIIMTVSGSPHVKAATIPAPLRSVFETNSLRRNIGEEMATAFSTLIATPCAFRSGYFLNPKQIHPTK